MKSQKSDRKNAMRAAKPNALPTNAKDNKSVAKSKKNGQDTTKASADVSPKKKSEKQIASKRSEPARARTITGEKKALPGSSKQGLPSRIKKYSEPPEKQSQQPLPDSNTPVHEDEPYVSTLPEFASDEERLRYFGLNPADFGFAIESAKPTQASAKMPDAQSAGEILDFSPDSNEEDIHNFAPEMDEQEQLQKEVDPIEELAALLATAQEAESVKLNVEMLHHLRDEDIALQEVEVIRLTEMGFAQVKNGVIDLKNESHALITGKSQAFFHDRTSGKLHGEDVYAFVYDYATVESRGARIIAAGHALIYAEGGSIGAKDESIVYAKGGARVKAHGDVIVVAEDRCYIEAYGTASVLVNSPYARIRLLSDSASVIVMDLVGDIPKVETSDRTPPKVYQLVSIDSPLGLEKMMELSFREAQRKDRLSWDYS